jgi:hypothetical protein
MTKNIRKRCVFVSVLRHHARWAIAVLTVLKRDCSRPCQVEKLRNVNDHLKKSLEALLAAPKK